jgi:NTP pyrophosphatase (non-canonical NTP hydrolase)
MSLTFKKLRTANTKRGIEWMGGPNTIEDLLFNATELGGEAGEVLNAVKKLSRFMKGVKGGVPVVESKQAIAEELADVIICCDRVAESLHIDLAEAVVHKFNKTSDKYGLSTKLNG